MRVANGGFVIESEGNGGAFSVPNAHAQHVVVAAAVVAKGGWEERMRALSPLPISVEFLFQLSSRSLPGRDPAAAAERLSTIGLPFPFTGRFRLLCAFVRTNHALTHALPRAIARSRARSGGPRISPGLSDRLLSLPERGDECASSSPS